MWPMVHPMNEQIPPPENPEADRDSQSPQLIPYDIPAAGSLGLLAVGYRGLLAWREKRAAAVKDNPPEHPDG